MEMKDARRVEKASRKRQREIDDAFHIRIYAEIALGVMEEGRTGRRRWIAHTAAFKHFASARGIVLDGLPWNSAAYLEAITGWVAKRRLSDPKCDDAFTRWSTARNLVINDQKLVAVNERTFH